MENKFRSKLEEPDISYEMYLELNGWKLVE